MTKYENPQTANLSKVLQDCLVLQQLLIVLGMASRERKEGEGDEEEQQQSEETPEGVDTVRREVVGMINFKTLAEKSFLYFSPFISTFLYPFLCI